MPTLDYHTPRDASYPWRKIRRIMAILSAAIGLLLTGLFIVGLHIGNTSLIDPPKVQSAWLIPLILIVWPAGMLCGNLLDRWYKRGVEDGL